MYLVVFTRKRLKPLIRKVPLFILLALPAVPLAFTAAAIYFRFEAAALERRVAGLRQEIAAADAQLAAADSLSRLTVKSSAANKTGPADILLHPRPPRENNDPLPASHAAILESGGVYAVQISSHHSRAEAERVIAELSSQLTRRLITRPARVANGTWYRVLIEPFDSREAASAYADSLSRAGVIREFILHRLPEDWRGEPQIENPATN